MLVDGYKQWNDLHLPGHLQYPHTIIPLIPSYLAMSQKLNVALLGAGIFATEGTPSLFPPLYNVLIPLYSTHPRHP